MLPEDQKQILYYLSGHTIFSIIKKRMKTCQNCLPLSVRKGYNIDISKYQKLKDYTGEALIECNQQLFNQFFVPAEELFRHFVNENEVIRKKNILESLMVLFFRDREKHFECHDFDEVLAKRFFTIRLHLHGKEVSRLKRKRKHGSENSSKSVQSRVLAKEHRLGGKKAKKQIVVPKKPQGRPQKKKQIEVPKKRRGRPPKTQ